MPTTPLRRTTRLRNALFLLRMGLGLAVFTPLDAFLLASQTRFPTHALGGDFLVWLTLLGTALVALWKLARAQRHERLGADDLADSVAPLLGSEVSLLLGLFGLLLPAADPAHAVGREWEWGFRLGGVALLALGAFFLYRYARPPPAADATFRGDRP